MTGKHRIILSNSKVMYDFYIERNITIIMGDSGTGKSTFYKMIARMKDPSVRNGPHCNVKDKIEVLLSTDRDWHSRISTSSGKIFVADEHVWYIYTPEFASLANQCDNYFILVTRRALPNLCYSVSSIYHLDNMRLNGKPVNYLYARYLNSKVSVSPDVVISEDSKSGFEMLSLALNYKVTSSNGNSNIYARALENLKLGKTTYAVVDGAAFGAYAEQIVDLIQDYPDKLFVYAPESFEYLLLSEEHIKRDVVEELAHTYDYCDSNEYKSWERYYTSLLNNWMLQHRGIPYSKSTLQDFFKTPTFVHHMRNSLVDLK